MLDLPQVVRAVASGAVNFGSRGSQRGQVRGRPVVPMSGRLPATVTSALGHGTLERVVNIEAEDGIVVLRLTSDEAERLAVAICADHETVSRAEYYIRYGLSRPEVRVLADAIAEAATRGDGGRSVPLLPGVEDVENPRRPRQ